MCLCWSNLNIIIYDSRNLSMQTNYRILQSTRLHVMYHIHSISYHNPNYCAMLYHSISQKGSMYNAGCMAHFKFPPSTAVSFLLSFFFKNIWEPYLSIDIFWCVFDKLQGSHNNLRDKQVRVLAHANSNSNVWNTNLVTLRFERVII